LYSICFQRVFADTQQTEQRRITDRDQDVHSAPQTQPSIERIHTASQTENDRPNSASRKKQSSPTQGDSSQTGSLSDPSSIASDLSKSLELASYSNKSSSDKPTKKEQRGGSDNLSSSLVTEDLAVVTDSETQKATRKRKSPIRLMRNREFVSVSCYCTS
jgi:hypothetical protein